jgi:hypothetical protein
MDNTLRIFISHKMPTDTSLAEDIGKHLSLYGGNQVKVTHAGRFRYGEQWRNRIEKELDEADWLIFLYTDPDEDWGFCLYECGYFRRSMENNKNKKKRLITFCRNQDQISEALKEFNALVVDENSAKDILENIYLDEPWKINPDLDPKILAATASTIVGVFVGTEVVEQNFGVTPSVTFELLLTDSVMHDLKDGRLAPDIAVSGTDGWERLFGREINTGGWRWRDLIASWPFAWVYEFLIAKMISDALDARMPKGTILRVPDFDGSTVNALYRMTLRSYERMRGGSKHRFHFTAAPLDLPFDLPEPGKTAGETVLYHLINLTWYFRRRVVDQLYKRVLEVLTIPKRDQVQAAANVYDALGRELMQVAAQAIIRRLDNSHMLEEALDKKDEKTQTLLERLQTYHYLQRHIFDAMQTGPKGLHSIVIDLHQMAMLNYDLYQTVAEEYSELAQELPPPPLPSFARTTMKKPKKPKKLSINMSHPRIPAGVSNQEIG